jgi:hypothetical protein
MNCPNCLHFLGLAIILPVETNCDPLNPKPMKSALKKLSVLTNPVVYRNFFLFMLSLGVFAALLYVLINSPA